MATNQDVQGNLPLTETTFLILLSLAPRPKHGYAIMKDVQSLSQDRVILSTGTLYGALKRLLEQGWIARVDESGRKALDQEGRPRKEYRLTDLGRHILNAETERLQALVSAARLRIAEERP